MRSRNCGYSFTRRSPSRAVFQQLDVPKKITVAWPGAIELSDRFCPWIGKFGLESSSKESPGASFRSDAAYAPNTQTIVICATKANAQANHMAVILNVFPVTGLGRREHRFRNRVPYSSQNA